MTTHFGQVKAVLDTGVDEVQLDLIAARIEDAWKEGRNVFIAGNGGSAATAIHFVCDLRKGVLKGAVGQGVRAYDLHSISSVTAIGNDLDYKQVFSEQLETLAVNRDILIVISVSGSSPNIVQALETAKKVGMEVYGMFGKRVPATVVQETWKSFVVDSESYEVVEDIHNILCHAIVRNLQKRYALWPK